MPAIFSKEKLEFVWKMLHDDMPRSEIAKRLCIDMDALDAYILAAYKKFTQPVMRYKLDNQMSLFNTTTAPKKQRKKSPVYIRRSREAEPPMERPRAVYSNIDYSKKYL